MAATDLLSPLTFGAMTVSARLVRSVTSAIPAMSASREIATPLSTARRPSTSVSAHHTCPSVSNRSDRDNANHWRHR